MIPRNNKDTNLLPNVRIQEEIEILAKQLEDAKDPSTILKNVLNELELEIKKNGVTRELIKKLDKMLVNNVIRDNLKKSLHHQFNSIYSSANNEFLQTRIRKSRELFGNLNLMTFEKLDTSDPTWTALTYDFCAVSESCLMEILNTESLAESLLATTRWIHYLKDCYYKGDMHTFFAIKGALTNTLLQTFVTHNQLPENTKKIFNHIMKKFPNTSKEEEAVAIKHMKKVKGSLTPIPYVGHAMTTFTFISDKLKGISEDSSQVMLEKKAHLIHEKNDKIREIIEFQKNNKQAYDIENKLSTAIWSKEEMQNVKLKGTYELILNDRYYKKLIEQQQEKVKNFDKTLTFMTNLLENDQAASDKLKEEDTEQKATLAAQIQGRLNAIAKIKEEKDIRAGQITILQEFRQGNLAALAVLDIDNKSYTPFLDIQECLLKEKLEDLKNLPPENNIPEIVEKIKIDLSKNKEREPSKLSPSNKQQPLTISTATGFNRTKSRPPLMGGKKGSSLTGSMSMTSLSWLGKEKKQQTVDLPELSPSSSPELKKEKALDNNNNNNNDNYSAPKEASLISALSIFKNDPASVSPSTPPEPEAHAKVQEENETETGQKIKKQPST